MKPDQDPPKGMLQDRPYVVRDEERTLVTNCPFCGFSTAIPLGLAAGQGVQLCPCGAMLRGGFAQKLVELKLTAKERRALRLFRDRIRERRARTRVHGLTRHSLERKGLLRGRRLTALGRAALEPSLNVSDIFADLFPDKKEA